jgi:uncharacterized metal-binding protein YceD (DUF177 family)
VASPLLINIIEMTRRAGTLKDIEITIPVSTFDFADKRLNDETEIEIALQLESINGGIIVQGTVTGQSQLLCGRCLRTIEYANVASIDEMYQRVPDNPDAYPIVGESLDLQPMVREMVLLSLHACCFDNFVGLALGFDHEFLTLFEHPASLTNFVWQAGLSILQ